MDQGRQSHLSVDGRNISAIYDHLCEGCHEAPSKPVVRPRSYRAHVFRHSVYRSPGESAYWSWARSHPLPRAQIHWPHSADHRGKHLCRPIRFVTARVERPFI